MDPLQVAIHDVFIKTCPNLAKTIRELVDAGQSKRKIMIALRRNDPDGIIALAAECEVDYLIAAANTEGK